MQSKRHMHCIYRTRFDPSTASSPFQSTTALKLPANTWWALALQALNSTMWAHSIEPYGPTGGILLPGWPLDTPALLGNTLTYTPK